VSMQLDNRLKIPGGIKGIKMRPWDDIVGNSGPVFGEETCQVGGAECAKRCIEELNYSYSICAQESDAALKARCNEEALARASNCQDRCTSSFPPNLNVCPPIGV
jgi:hypothetical protein